MHASDVTLSQNSIDTLRESIAEYREVEGTLPASLARLCVADDRLTPDGIELALEKVAERAGEEMMPDLWHVLLDCLAELRTVPAKGGKSKTPTFPS